MRSRVFGCSASQCPAPSAVLQRHLAVHLLEHVEHAARRRVESGVLAERPTLPTMTSPPPRDFFHYARGGTG